MNNGEQFKIDSIEELEQAYEMFDKDNWLSNIRILSIIYTCFERRFITKIKDKFLLCDRKDYCKLIPSPLKNKSMFNKELIQKLREGEIAVKNDGSLEQLRAVLKEAFPEDDDYNYHGQKLFYRKWETSNALWRGFCDNENIVKISVDNFFDLDLKGFPKKYVLREPNHLFEDELSPGHPNVDYLTKAGVFEALYKPIYKKDKPKLPEINGYDGELVSEISGKAIKYGCAFLSIDWFKETKNRHILYLPLSSGVVIDAEEMQQIRKYLKYYDHI